MREQVCKNLTNVWTRKTKVLFANSSASLRETLLEHLLWGCSRSSVFEILALHVVVPVKCLNLRKQFARSTLSPVDLKSNEVKMFNQCFAVRRGQGLEFSTGCYKHHTGYIGRNEKENRISELLNCSISKPLIAYNQPCGTILKYCKRFRGLTKDVRILIFNLLP